MLTYDVLAALWGGSGSDIEVTRAVEDRLGTSLSRNIVDQHLRLLRTTGFVRTKSRDGGVAYELTDAGSTLLSQLAEGVTPEETP